MRDRRWQDAATDFFEVAAVLGGVFNWAHKQVGSQTKPTNTHTHTHTHTQTHKTQKQAQLNKFKPKYNSNPYSKFKFKTKAFRAYDEAGSPRRVACLKYLVLASMLMESSVDPFDSQV